MLEQIKLVSETDTTVLILGENGTGKELVARNLYRLSKRSKHAFIKVNCAAFTPSLLESELFGHEKGAFTGAVSRTIGKFEQANGGTLFLDEIGDMPIEAQTRLLRALQSGRIRRVGGSEEIAIDVRIVAATNKDLEPLIAAGLFREDLFYRLNVVPIQLPPLRDRAEDIPALAEHFLAEAAEEGLPLRALEAAAAALLVRQPWRGNVRELKNFMFRAALMAREESLNEILVRSLLDEQPGALAVDGGRDDSFDSALHMWLKETSVASGSLYHSALAAFEKPLFEHALSQTGGNQLRAAQLLGINRNTLRKRLGELAIDPDRFSEAS